VLEKSTDEDGPRRLETVEFLSSRDNLDEAPNPLRTGVPLVMRLRLAAAVAWTLVIMLLCWLPKRVVRRAARVPWFGIPHLDKVVHAGIFVVFAILWLRALKARGRSGYAWVALGGLFLAVLTEVGQLIPWVGRDASVEDTLTDVAGLVVGLVAAARLEPWLLVVESRLVRTAFTVASRAIPRSIGADERT
jgi:VanZ family protein